MNTFTVRFIVCHF